MTALLCNAAMCCAMYERSSSGRVQCTLSAINASASYLFGNLAIPLLDGMQPLTFTAGKRASAGEKTAGETAGGLFSGQSGPQPPPALSTCASSS